MSAGFTAVKSNYRKFRKRLRLKCNDQFLYFYKEAFYGLPGQFIREAGADGHQQIEGKLCD